MTNQMDDEQVAFETAEYMKPTELAEVIASLHFASKARAFYGAALIANVGWDEADKMVKEAQVNKYLDESTSAAASAMGRIRSERKAAAVRENGKKGGRPRKQ